MPEVNDGIYAGAGHETDGKMAAVRWLALLVVGCYDPLHFQAIDASAREDAPSDALYTSGCVASSFTSETVMDLDAQWNFGSTGGLTQSGWNADPGATLTFYAPGLLSANASVSLTLVTGSDPTGLVFTLGDGSDNVVVGFGASATEFGVWGDPFTGGAGPGNGNSGSGVETFAATFGNATANMYDVTLSLNGQSQATSPFTLGSGSAITAPMLVVGSGGALISLVTICF
jgi:hypothetical protein